jgi:hypothetical protein
MMRDLPIFSWSTPLISLPVQQRGKWTIRKLLLKKGYYAEMTMDSFGCGMWYCMAPITLTILEEKRKWDEYLPGVDRPEDEYETLTWMSDSPGEYFGQLDLISRILPKYNAKGELQSQNILVGGLGLGLIIHQLKLRKDIDQIFVIEIDPDIIALVWPYIMARFPNGEIKLRQGDFFEEIPKLAKDPHYNKKFDAIIVDLWQTNDDIGEALFTQSKEIVERFFPRTQALYWLFQSEVEEDLAQK